MGGLFCVCVYTVYICPCLYMWRAEVISCLVLFIHCVCVCLSVCACARVRAMAHIGRRTYWNWLSLSTMWILEMNSDLYQLSHLSSPSTFFFFFFCDRVLLNLEFMIVLE